MKVSIEQCNSYELKEVQQAIFNSVNNLEFKFKDVNKILLKPNVLGPYAPEKATTTHPKILEALILLLKSKELIIGDSCGDMNADTERAMEKAGIKEIANQYNVKILPFEKDKKIKLNTKNPYLKDILFPQTIKEVDLIINLPKLKTHCLTQYSGATKNLFGIIPGGQKNELHSQLKSPKEFSQMLLALEELIKPKLNIMDGVIGMEGNGPTAGTPKITNKILASRSAQHLDQVASKMIDIKNVPTLIQDLTLDEAEIIGDLEIIPYQKPSSTIKLAFYTPKFLRKALFDSALIINKTKCKKCNICVNNCPKQAIKNYTINNNKCIKCFCCMEFCPEHAIEIKQKPTEKIIRKILKI